MCLFMRPFFLTCLAMLQMIAPLAHAHAAQHGSGFGLHIPGLETYGANSPMLAGQATHYSSDTGNFIFNVEDGIRQSRSIQNKSAQNDCPPILRDITIYSVFLPFPTDSFSLSPLLASHSRNGLLSPRAPPSISSGTP
jgi:hypothetical protein